MAFYRAFEFKPSVDFTEFGFLYPVSLEDGSGHELLYLYGPFRFASEVDVFPTAPASSGTPSLNSNQIEVMR